LSNGNLSDSIPLLKLVENHVNQQSFSQIIDTFLLASQFENTDPEYSLSLIATTNLNQLSKHPHLLESYVFQGDPEYQISKSYLKNPSEKFFDLFLHHKYIIIELTCFITFILKNT